MNFLTEPWYRSSFARLLIVPALVCDLKRLEFVRYVRTSPCQTKVEVATVYTSEADGLLRICLDKGIAVHGEIEAVHGLDKRVIERLKVLDDLLRKDYGLVTAVFSHESCGLGDDEISRYFNQD